MSKNDIIFLDQNDKEEFLLNVLSLNRTDFGRFRGVAVIEGKIEIYARIGGDNREDYQDVFLKLSKHPNYLYDEDNEYDNTYATIYFSIPEKYAEQVKKLEKKAYEKDI